MTKLADLFFQRDGQHTRDLLLSPTGFGLGMLPQNLKPDQTTRMVCGFCSTGCGLNVHLRDGQAIGLSPTTEYPVNLGMACPKGWESLTVLNAPDRATTPLLRNAKGKLEPVNWPTALKTFCERLRLIQAEHGAESVAFISTGQIATEEMALLGSLAKFGMGIVHGDGNTRQCMATAVVAYKQSFGFDAPPYTYQDFEESDVIVLVGSNLCIAHPIMWERIVRNPHRPEIIVVDPRCTETAMQATRHLPIKPKSDLSLFYGLARLLIENDWIDREFIDANTHGFAEFATFVQEFTPERVARDTGLNADTLFALAKVLHEGKRVSLWWTMGVNQSYEGVRTAQSLINLALMTGNIGRPGTGANSITGQCNAMGSRLFSNTTGLLGGHDFLNAEHRVKVAKILGIDESRIPRTNSLAYPEIIEGILRGKIKGLWVIATNPVHSWINQNQLKEIFERLDFLVVQDMYHSTETAQVANLVLPAAAWGEKDGTFINSERRYGVIKKVARAPGQALTDFAIFKLIAEEWGCGDLFREWTSPEATFQILKRLTVGQPCDISGIRDYRMLDECGGIQWPWTRGQATGDRGQETGDKRQETGDRVQETGNRGQWEAERHPNAARDPDAVAPSPLRGEGWGEGSSETAPVPNTHRRLFEDGRFYHADGKAKFIFEAPRPMSEPTTKAYPFILLTGRGTASQWHTQTRTKKSAVLRKLYPEDLHVEIHPSDAEAHGVSPQSWVHVESQRGRVKAKALVTPTVAPGTLFIAMHHETANQLTDAVFDPYSRQPSYKACAVRVRKARES